MFRKHPSFLRDEPKINIQKRNRVGLLGYGITKDTMTRFRRKRRVGHWVRFKIIEKSKARV